MNAVAAAAFLLLDDDEAEEEVVEDWFNVEDDGDMARFDPESDEVDDFLDMGELLIALLQPPPFPLPLPSSIETNMGFSLSNSLLNNLKSFHC